MLYDLFWVRYGYGEISWLGLFRNDIGKRSEFAMNLGIDGDMERFPGRCAPPE
jgi:hypothetical protein